MQTRLDLALTALNTLQAAMDALRDDETLTQDQRISLDVMLNQIPPCVMTWRNEISKAQGLLLTAEPDLPVLPDALAQE